MCKECDCEENYHEDDCSCGCREWHHGHKRFGVRRFLTKDEKIKKLENYAEDLRKELTAVQERVKELKSKQK
ncbi:DUF5320 domain-containing protein [Candidatus Bathyarchaeota archaeon]|nr:DUF5320 domain-containing protein [Candidatus Bathyarchaeota archaeon]